MHKWKWDESKTTFTVDGRGKFQDLTGNMYGRLEALYPVYRHKKRVYWKCRCKCGNEIDVSQKSLVSENTKSCGCFHDELIVKRNQDRYKGYEDLSGNHFSQIKYNAKIRKLEFNITIEYLWNLYLKQNKKCALSGVELVFSRSKMGDTNASLDRIDSSKGYIEGNVQWVEKMVNQMKLNLTEEEFIKRCSLICSFRGK